MNEEDLRVLVRDVVARRLAAGHAAPAGQPLTAAAHPSHLRHVLPPSDGPCLIEPAVACNKCGFCESHGH